MADSRRAARGRIIAAAAGTFVRPADGRPGTVSGALRRGWMRLEAAVGGREAVVDTVTGAERDLLEEFDRALGHDLPVGVADAVRRARREAVNGSSMLEAWDGE